MPSEPTIAAGGAPPAGEQLTAGQPLPPLPVSGLVVARRDLVRALTIYIPQLTDIQELPDGRFILVVGDGAPR